MPSRRRLALPLSLLMTIGLLLGVVTPAAAAPTTLNAILTGAEEVPGPGDPNGAGTATVTVDPVAGTLCYTYSVGALANVTGAHIHEAPPGVAGPIQVGLTLPDTTGTMTDCADTADYNAAELPTPTAVTAFLADLAANPQKYYVNVHTSPFSEGAIRGQLNNPRLCGTVTRSAADVISIGTTVVPASILAADAALAAQLNAAATAAASVCVDATYNPSGTVLTAANLDATFTLCAAVTATGSGATRAFTVGGLAIPATQLSASETAALELALVNRANACVNLVIVDTVITSVSGHVDVCVTVGARSATSITLDGVAIPLGTGSTVPAAVTTGTTLAVRVAVSDGVVTITTTTLSGCTTVTPSAAALPDTSVEAGAPAPALLIGIGVVYLLGAVTLLARRGRFAA